MPLFRRRERLPELASPHKAVSLETQRFLGDTLCWWQASTGQQMAIDAHRLAKQTRSEIIDHQGSADDILSLSEALESLYTIAVKLDQIDRTLVKATAGNLGPSLANYDWHSKPKSWGMWKQALEGQDEDIVKWTSSVEGENKRRWFAELRAQRTEIGVSLLESFKHMQSLRHDFSFLHTASTSGLLPDFVLDDAKGELLTSEGAAEKARALAEGVAELELPPPPLAGLDEAPVTGELSESARPELS